MSKHLIIALSTVAVVSANLYKDDPTHLKQLWESFKTEYGKSYDTMDEESNRFQIFVQILKLADKRNDDERAANGKAVHGITKYADLSQSEFESRYLTADPSMKKELGKVAATQEAAISGAKDWTGILTTAVKDQVRFFLLFCFFFEILNDSFLFVLFLIFLGTMWFMLGFRCS
jgi:hypothetical protein